MQAGILADTDKTADNHRQNHIQSHRRQAFWVNTKPDDVQGVSARGKEAPTSTHKASKHEGWRSSAMLGSRPWPWPLSHARTTGWGGEAGISPRSSVMIGTGKFSNEHIHEKIKLQRIPFNILATVHSADQ